MFDLLFNINHTVFSIGDYAVSGLELWATLTGLICVIMARMNMKHNFTVGIVNCIGFAILFFQIQLYSDVLLQGFFIAMSIFGFYQWNKQGGCSSLGGTIEDSVFYARDRGEELEIYIDNIPEQEYNYMFKDGKWFVCCPETNWEDVVLTNELRVELENYEE